jgi:cytochrome c
MPLAKSGLFTALLIVALAVLVPVPGAPIAAAAEPAKGAAAPPVKWAVDPDDEWQGLPEGPGREQVFYTCPACHSLMMVRQQGLSRDVWEETLDWMVKEQKMDPMDPKDRELALDYLAKWYGPDRKALNRTK